MPVRSLSAVQVQVGHAGWQVVGTGFEFAGAARVTNRSDVAAFECFQIGIGQFADVCRAVDVAPLHGFAHRAGVAAEVTEVTAAFEGNGPARVVHQRIGLSGVLGQLYRRNKQEKQEIFH